MKITVRKLADMGLWNKYCETTGADRFAPRNGAIGLEDSVDAPDELLAPIFSNLEELNVNTKVGPIPTIESLELALLLQWEFNHGIHCGNAFPHAGQCRWGIPDELSHHTLEEIEAMREKLKYNPDMNRQSSSSPSRS